MFNLSGKVALITGANTGIGQAIALALAQAGADIAAVSRTPATATVEQAKALGRRAHYFHADLASITPITNVIENIRQEIGRIDILVNNAGIIRRADAVEFSESDWDAVIDTNLKSVFFMCQAVGRQMLEQGSGKIINIASMLSFQGGVRVASYTAAKSGVVGLTKLLANEWAAKGINVNAIAPGYIATANTAALRQDLDRNRAIVDRIPAARWGTPDDLAGAAVFLASTASNYVNGHVLAVDGGWLAR